MKNSDTGLRQKQYMNNLAKSPERHKIHESWFNEESVDFWRHNRMYDTISPVAKTFANESWLTVGDGRFGLDAVRLTKMFGIQDILPTDTSEIMLQQGKERGIIESYRVEDCEQLSFSDNSFGVVFCKEAFHHFQKPFMALYEMIRVARRAVVLVEPLDGAYNKRIKSLAYLSSACKVLLSKISGRRTVAYIPEITPVEVGFEEAGNFIYAINEREIIRMAYGMGLPAVAFKRFNDCYIKGCEFETATPGNPTFDQITKTIKNMDALNQTEPAYSSANMISVVLFLEKPSDFLISEMENNSFYFPTIKTNPYSCHR